MEPIGVALGIASLFTTCVDCFELVQSGRYLGQEYHLLETKFINQRIRLVAWGKACGFTDPNGYDRQIDENKEVHDAIESSLLHLISLLRDGDKLKRKYGLRDADQTASGIPSPNALLNAPQTWPLLAGGQSAVASLTQKLAKFRERTKATQQQANLRSKARWAIKDKDKFADLVQHLRDLIEDLEGLTAGLHLEHRQRELIRQEVEAIREIPVLESIEEARVGRLDPVSDAASLRLWSVRDRFSCSAGESSCGAHGSRFSFSQRRSSRDRSPSPLSPLTGGDERGIMFYSPTGEGRDADTSDEDWEALSRVPSLSPTPSPGLDYSGNSHYQVLHRVNCEFCSPAIYLDVPDYGTECSTTNQWMVLDEYHPLHEPRTLHLCGKRPIVDLDTYLGQNRQLHFLVFQEYQCRHGVEGLVTGTTAPKPLSNGQSVYLASEELCIAVRHLADRAPGTRLPDFEPQAELQYPFYWFFHSRQTLEKELSGLGESNTMILVHELMDFIDDSTFEEYAKVDELLARRVVTWNILKYLYAPDDIVVQKHADGLRRSQAYRILDGQWTETSDRSEMTINAYYVACQDRLVPVQKNLTITRGNFGDVDSEVAIEELPILPLRYTSHITLRELDDRSQRLTGYSESPINIPYRWVCYSGTEVNSILWMYAVLMFETYYHVQDNLRLIIDPSLYWKRSHQSDGSTKDSQPTSGGGRPNDPFLVPEELTPRDLPLLEPTVHGFDLRTHEWRHLYVADLREVEWNTNAFDDLILDENEKALLLGSVQSATTPETNGGVEANALAVTSTPPLQTKKPSGGGGGGSVYLFHGDPGTGKTFATNCISERTRKPLYHMTPFATGVSAEAVQRNMDATLALAQRWDCMLVLEDADAMAHVGSTGSGGSGTGGSSGSQVQHEVPRRAMTMALLKLLDSFGGIVVLISSRVNVLDEALFSRVHLAIYFPDLDAAGRRKIWHDATTADSSSGGSDDKSFGEGGGQGATATVAAAGTSSAEVDPYLLTREAEQKLAAVELNGREIRNVVAQVLRIARFQGEALRLELVESVLRQAVKLQQYRASLVQGNRALTVKTPTDAGRHDDARATEGVEEAWPPTEPSSSDDPRWNTRLGW
ncbi:aaa family atpase protein [Apiospora marii]|uniref:Aaa family atpase protein n=1 Tax=Apiospora marii TaxID=335849 RepID=A0ABR1RLT5_9PEZI